MSIGIEKEKVYYTQGWRGVPSEQLPNNLLERVANANKELREARTELRSGETGVEFNILSEPWEHDEFTDVFVYDGRNINRSFHRGDDGKVYELRYVGHWEPYSKVSIANAMGFDKEKAEVIHGKGHKMNRKHPRYQSEPSGPYYGMKSQE